MYEEIRGKSCKNPTWSSRVVHGRGSIVYCLYSEKKFLAVHALYLNQPLNSDSMVPVLLSGACTVWKKFHGYFAEQVRK